jgi:FixJ family two-component response regulator
LHTRKHVFVVDDDPGMLRAIDRLLRRHGYDTVLFESAEAFEKHNEVAKALCLCILLDINLNNGRSGIELRRNLKEAGHAVPVIYMTGKDSPDVHKAALESGCVAYLVKPISTRSLIVPLERAAGLRQANV